MLKGVAEKRIDSRGNRVEEKGQIYKSCPANL